MPKLYLWPGTGEIGGIVAGDLQEDAAVRSALVGLAGRMQEARPEAEAGRHALAVADHDADVLQRVAVLLVALDIGEQRAIVAGVEPREMRLEPAGERVAAGRRQRLAVPRIGEELEPVAL